MVGTIYVKEERMNSGQDQDSLLTQRTEIWHHIPKSVQEALRIDEETKTTFWADAIRNEMGSNIIPALRILEPG
jgi:hypothetical protein